MGGDELLDKVQPEARATVVARVGHVNLLKDAKDLEHVLGADAAPRVAHVHKHHVVVRVVPDADAHKAGGRKLARVAEEVEEDLDPPTVHSC